MRVEQNHDSDTEFASDSNVPCSRVICFVRNNVQGISFVMAIPTVIAAIIWAGHSYETYSNIFGPYMISGEMQLPNNSSARFTDMETDERCSIYADGSAVAELNSKGYVVARVTNPGLHGSWDDYCRQGRLVTTTLKAWNQMLRRDRPYLEDQSDYREVVKTARRILPRTCD